MGPKRNKIDRTYKIDKLPLLPRVSNIAKASYQFIQYLPKLLPPLSKSEYTVQSSTELMEHIKTKTVPHGYHIISFDVISLLTYALLDYMIDIISKFIHNNREINATTNKKEMKQLIKLCTKMFTLISMELCMYRKTEQQWIHC